jgi:hypothetical protein
LSLSDDIIVLLGKIGKSQSEIKLLNIYKGLPLSYETVINSVNEFEICVPSSKQHMACLYHQGETYVQGDKIPFLIRSQVISLNLAKDEAVLSNFEVAKPDIGKRSQIRVVPEESLIAFIHFIGSGYDVPAPLLDISAEGASIFLESHLFPARQFQTGNEITFTVSFPDTLSQKIKKLSTKTLNDIRTTKPLNRPNMTGWQDGRVTITAQGKIVSVRPELHLNRYRVGMKLFFQDLARMVIIQYISQRQAEIIRDLRLLSEELYTRKNL